MEISSNNCGRGHPQNPTIHLGQLLEKQISLGFYFTASLPLSCIIYSICTCLIWLGYVKTFSKLVVSIGTHQ